MGGHFGQNDQKLHLNRKIIVLGQNSRRKELIRIMEEIPSVPGETMPKNDYFLLEATEFHSFYNWITSDLILV